MALEAPLPVGEAATTDFRHGDASSGGANGRARTDRVGAVTPAKPRGVKKLKRELYERELKRPQLELVKLRAGTILIKYRFAVSDKGAGAAIPGSNRAPRQALEDQRHGPRGAQALVRLREGQGPKFSHTDVPDSPWWVVDAGDKRRAPELHPPPALDDRLPGDRAAQAQAPATSERRSKYTRPPIESMRWIPSVF